MNWFRKNLRRIVRTLLKGGAVVWLAIMVTPCAVAAPACPPDSGRQTLHADSLKSDQYIQALAGHNPCEGMTSVDCLNPEEGVRTGSPSAMDFTVVPGITYPLAVEPADNPALIQRRHMLLALHIPHPPLNLQHSVFLY